MHSHTPELSLLRGAESGRRGFKVWLRDFMPQKLQPERFCRFERIEEVGSGCMGDVKRAFDSVLNRNVALKVPNRHLRGRISIENEIWTLSRIRHDNVARFLDGGVFSDGPYEGRPFLVMEFIEGENLLAKIKGTGPLPRSDARQILMQLCEALSAVHESGFVHRDIKPENIILGRELVLIDFGVSEPLQPKFSLRSLMVTKFMPGNAEFAAPEIFVGKCDQRTDIYSAGMLLRLLRTGTLPRNPTLLFGGPISSPSGLLLMDDVLSEEEIKVISRATSNCPESRHASAAELKADISRIRD